MSDRLTNMLTADMEYRLQVAAKMDLLSDDEPCECARYLIENRERLLPKMVEAAERNNEEADVVVARFVAGVHERHVSGRPLAAGWQPADTAVTG